MNTTLHTNHPAREPAVGLPGVVAVGFYAWLATVSFGLVVLDIAYSRLVPGAAAAFSEIADFLLAVDAITGIAALSAIGLAWNSGTTRTLVATGIGVVALGFLIYPLLATVLRDASSLGAGLRVALAATVSLLAFAGFALLRKDL